MFATYAKKEVSKKDWEFYSKIPTYMFLEKSNLGAGENVWMAFSAPTEDEYGPEGTTLLSDDELRRYDLHCRSNNIYPRPFEDVEKTEEPKGDNEEIKDRMDVMKDWLKGKYGLFKV